MLVRVKKDWIARTAVGLAAAFVSAAPNATAGPIPAAPSCEPPVLPGSVVDVTVTDMGAMMGPGMMGGPMMGGMMGGGMMGHDGHGMGMMQIVVSPRSVPAGEVSLRAFNRGGLVHEVVVMPLGPGQGAGRRPIGADGKIDEAGSLGEAANTCGSGDGDGLAPGTWSWTTLNLSRGRYELLCNIAGHYGSGMYTELDVT